MIDQRLFIGLPMTGSLAVVAKDWQTKHFAWPVDWLSAEQLHLTLVAPWLTEDIPQVISRLEEFAVSELAAEIFRQASTVEFSKVSFGPNQLTPRLIWAEGRPPVFLLELKNRLEQVLAKPDHRFYRLHLTLARFQLSDFVTMGGTQALPELNETINWQTPIDRFALYQSTFQPSKVDYLKLKEFCFPR